MCCNKHGDNISGAIIAGEFLNQLSDYYLIWTLLPGVSFIVTFTSPLSSLFISAGITVYKSTCVYSHPDTTPLYIPPPSHSAHESPRIRNSTCNFKSNPPIKCHHRQLPSSSICGSTYVPLSIIFKSNTLLCHFVSTGYTNNSLEN